MGSDVKKKNTANIILIVIGALVLLCALCSAVFVLLVTITGNKTSNGGFFNKITESFDISGSGDLEGAIYINEVYTLEGEGDQEVKVFGNFKTNSTTPDSFDISNGGNILTTYFQNMDSKGLKDVDISDLVDGDPIVVEGIYDIEGWSFYAKKVVKTTNEAIEEYKLASIPQMKIEVIDFPSSVSHVCKNFDIKLKITNIGKVTINYDDVYNSYSTHNFGYSINDGETIASYATESEDESVIFMGLEDFGVLEPGDSAEVLFKGGGNVTQSVDPTWLDADGSPHVVGISGEMNMLYDHSAQEGYVGDNEVRFHWVQVSDPNNYDISFNNPVISSSSEPVVIKLLSGDCDMDDIQDTYMIQN